MTRAVPRGPEPFCQGISAKVLMSGMRYWSDSAIRVKPSIDEPSNQVPCRTEPSSWWIGIVTALTWPMTSVNWSWMKRMPAAFAASIFSMPSTASLIANGASAWCAGATAGRGLDPGTVLVLDARTNGRHDAMRGVYQPSAGPRREPRTAPNLVQFARF